MKLDLVLENTRNRYSLGLLEESEGMSEKEVLKGKILINESTMQIRKMLVEEGVMAQVQSLLQEGWGQRVAAVGGAGALGVGGKMAYDAGKKFVDTTREGIADNATNGYVNRTLAQNNIADIAANGQGIAANGVANTANAQHIAANTQGVGTNAQTLQDSGANSLANTNHAISSGIDTAKEAGNSAIAALGNYQDSARDAILKGVHNAGDSIDNFMGN